MYKIIKICLWFLAFIPLIKSNSFFYSASITEDIFMRLFLVLVNVLFLIHFFYKREFRIEITEKIKKFIKNPLVISVLAFVSISIISTVFAVDKYSAFWGEIERTEGLTGIIYLLSFFILSLSIFGKKDWIWFFKLSLFVSAILLFGEFLEFFLKIKLADFFIGSTTFLAGYLLFSILCSFIVFEESEDKFFRYFSIIIFFLSILGIFITANRGTIVGLLAGFLVILIFGIFRGKNIFFKRLNLRTASTIILCFLVIFLTVFISTRKSEIWQNVPGLSRIAVIGIENDTTATRLIMGKLSLQAVDPSSNGLKKFLIGWGPENFSIAYTKYFNPKQFDYEVGWFDRAHNKIFDVLVMNGLLGLIAYLAIYFFLFKSIFKRKEFSLLNTGLLFFGVSFFLHLVFVFSQITTSIPFFAVLAFVTSLNIGDNKEKIEYKKQIKNTIFINIFFSILTLFLCFVFFRNDLLAYLQLREYDTLKEKGDAKIMLNKIDKVFDPFTTAQAKIRYDLLSFVSENYNPESESIVKLSDISFSMGEEYVNKMPNDLHFLNILALTYTIQGKNSNDLKLLAKGEEYFKKLLLITPDKLDFSYGLALNWMYQKRYNESINLFEKVFDDHPKFFSLGTKLESIYIVFIKHFYEVKDKDNFIRVAERLKENNYEESETLDKIINFIEQNNFWPNINFS